MKVPRRAFISLPCFIFNLRIEHMGNHYIIPFTFGEGGGLKYVVRILK